MVIADVVKEVLSSTDRGVVLTIADFGIDPNYQQALVVALNRKVKQGELKRVAKGKYYKPKNTIFGTLPPSSDEVAKDFLKKGGVTIGYITGTRAFAQMGLTTQISSSILVGTDKYRRPLQRGDNKIGFLSQSNKITDDIIPLLRILDALRLIREIPASSPDESVLKIGKMIVALDRDEQRKLARLSLAYRPNVRALTGAIFEQNGIKGLTEQLRLSLNGVTRYELPISEDALSTKRNWNLI